MAKTSRTSLDLAHLGEPDMFNELPLDAKKAVVAAAVVAGYELYREVMGDD